MAWIAVDEDGTGFVYEAKPKRGDSYWKPTAGAINSIHEDAIEIIIGESITWNDEPVKVGEVN